jgi:hypothetical protein
VVGKKTLGATLHKNATGTQPAVWVNERGRPVAGRRPVVVSATPIGAGIAESADMSLSDRERAGAF